MALQEVNNIIETLRNAALRQNQTRQLDLQQQQQESEAANRLAMRDEAEARLAEEVKQHQREHDLAVKASDTMIAAHKVANAAALQQMGQTYQQTGVAPPGASASPAATTQSGASYTPVNPQQATSQVMSIPGVEGQIQVATPEQAASRQANIAETLAAPARKTAALKEAADTERQIAVTKATQSEETQRQLKVLDKTLTNQTQLEQMRIQGENYRNSVTQGIEKFKALLPYTWMNSMTPEQSDAMTKPYIDGLVNGDISSKQVHSDFNEKGMSGAGAAILGRFAAAGGVAPTEKQVEFKKKIAPIVDAVPLLKQYIDMLPDTSNTLGGAVKATAFGLTHPLQFNQQLKSIEQQIEFNIAPVARTLGGDEGQRLQKALLGPAEGGFMPSKSSTKEANISNYNKFIDVINGALKAQYPNDKQRAAIVSSLGIDKLTHLAPNGQPVSGSTQTQQVPGGATHIYFDANGNQVASPTVH